MPDRNDPTPDAIADQRTIADLLARYARATDELASTEPEVRERAARTYDEVFEPQARIGVRDQLSVEGASAWIDFVRRSNAGMRATQHLLGLPVVDLNGDAATVTCSLQSTQFGVQGEIVRVHANYEATATRSGGSSWRLSTLTVEVLAIDPPPSEERPT
ncbi:MAG: nuclear transport factor 2 family protein [Acidobacteriota bacterium]